MWQIDLEQASTKEGADLHQRWVLDLEQLLDSLPHFQNQMGWLHLEQEILDQKAAVLGGVDLDDLQYWQLSSLQKQELRDSNLGVLPSTMLQCLLHVVLPYWFQISLQNSHLCTQVFTSDHHKSQPEYELKTKPEAVMSTATAEGFYMHN